MLAAQPIRSAYLISQADFVGCHQLQFIDKYQMAERLKPGGIFLLNTPYSADEVWSRLPQEVQAVLNQKKARFYVINAAKIARECGLAARINTVMQMAFFHLTQILPGDSALAELQGAIAKSYSSKGQDLVERNWQALALARESVEEVPLQPVNPHSLALARESVEEVPLQPVNPHSANRPPVVSDAAPDFVKTVTAAMLAGLGDALPVSALPPDGTWPMGTTRWEKRNIAEEIPQTAPGRWAPRAGKNAISPKRSPSGKRNSVPNVTTVSPLAHTQLFAQRWDRLKRWKTPLPACIRWM